MRCHCIVLAWLAVCATTLFGPQPNAHAEGPDGSRLAVLKEAFETAPFSRVKTGRGHFTLSGTTLVNAGVGWEILKEPAGAALQNPIEWSEIERVEVMKYRRRGLLGAGVGAAVGAATGLMVSSNGGGFAAETLGQTLGYAAIFAIPGGLFGWLFPAKDWMTAYER